jgi:hypothetical protein
MNVPNSAMQTTEMERFIWTMPLMCRETLRETEHRATRHFVVGHTGMVYP